MADANSRPIDAPDADDAFGEMVWDYAHDRLVERPRYRRDDGHVTDAHLDGYFTDASEWPDSLCAALSTLDGPVLDAGCGVGRHARHLQQQGLEVFAIDRSPGAITVARQSGVEHAAVMDLRDLSILDSTFESLVVLGKQIALGNTLDALRDTFDRLAAVARPGGRLVADFDALDRRGDDYLADHRCSEGVASRRFRVEYDDLVGPWVDVLLLDPAALERVVAQTPWRVVDRAGPTDDGSGYLCTFERT